jgi:long-chain acyl-CoA synthetase
VYEKFLARIMERGHALPQPRRTLFHWGVKVAHARGRAEGAGGKAGAVLALETTLADRLVFSKIRESVGGRLWCLVSGSAPASDARRRVLSRHRADDHRGLRPDGDVPDRDGESDRRAAARHGGQADPRVEVRIAEDGEILVRGPNVMIGYYNKPDDTAAVLRNGWFHTGDVGQLDADGYLAITDRKKDLLVTSGGKKIAPQPIEAVLKRSPLIAEAVVLGDRRRFASALIVPDFAALERRLKDLGRPPAERDVLVQRDDVLALYAEVVEALNQELSQFERIKKIRLLPREFSIASGELTPTMKGEAEGGRAELGRRDRRDVPRAIAGIGVDMKPSRAVTVLVVLASVAGALAAARPASPPQTRKLKVHISVDMEGVAGTSRRISSDPPASSTDGSVSS